MSSIDIWYYYKYSIEEGPRKNEKSEEIILNDLKGTVYLYFFEKAGPFTQGGKNYPSLIQRLIDLNILNEKYIIDVRKIFYGKDPPASLNKMFSSEDDDKMSVVTEAEDNSKKVYSYSTTKRSDIFKQINLNLLNELSKFDIVAFPDVTNFKRLLLNGNKSSGLMSEPDAKNYVNNFIDYLEKYENLINFNPSLTPATPAGYEINYVTDLRTLMKNSSDPVKVAEYKAMIEEQANQIKQNVRVFDEKKIEALQQAKLEGLEISKPDYLNMLQKINNNKSYSLSPEDIEQLRLLNEDRLKKWLNAYELKEANILGIGARRSTFEKDIMRLVNSDINKGLDQTTKAKKLRDLTKPDQIMEFTYPYGFPSSTIKLENGSYNVHQDGKITKFGHKLSKAQQFAYNGGIYANDIKSKVQILRLDENDGLFKRQKYAWKISN